MSMWTPKLSPLQNESPVIIVEQAMQALRAPEKRSGFKEDFIFEQFSEN